MGEWVSIRKRWEAGRLSRKSRQQEKLQRMDLEYLSLDFVWQAERGI